MSNAGLQIGHGVARKRNGHTLQLTDECWRMVGELASRIGCPKCLIFEMAVRRFSDLPGPEKWDGVTRGLQKMAAEADVLKGAMPLPEWDEPK